MNAQKNEPKIKKLENRVIIQKHSGNTIDENNLTIIIIEYEFFFLIAIKYMFYNKVANLLGVLL